MHQLLRLPAVLLPLLALPLSTQATSSLAATINSKDNLPPSFLKPDARVPSNPVQHVLEHTPKDSTFDDSCNLSGPIETTQCDYETVESATEVLHSRLDELVKQPFFKYYKVDLFRECPFWQEDGLCMQRSCAVDSMDERDIPEAWRAEALSRVRTSAQKDMHHQYPGCYYRDSDFCFLDDDTSEDAQYIDLTLNPETFTGYAGDSAWRVWSAIYQENCFGLKERGLPGAEEVPVVGLSVAPLVLGGKREREEEGECVEKRAYYRIVSGMHASISTHLCYGWLDQSTGQWGPNLSCFSQRVASHPERLQNIYFNTVLLLRALTRLEPFLSAYDLRTGDVVADRETKRVLTSVLDVAKRVGRFDERALFKGENADLLKEQFKATFRNVSLIMDCVGCDKCRLWGKIQTSGVGTALKILFELDDRTLNPRTNPALLQRSEIVALVNTLHRFVESLHMTGTFRSMWAESEAKRLALEAADSDAAGAEPQPHKTLAGGRRLTPSSRASQPGEGEGEESIYVRLGELVRECGDWSLSACASLVRVVMDFVGRVGGVLGGSGKEGLPVMNREL